MKPVTAHCGAKGDGGNGKSSVIDPQKGAVVVLVP